MIERLEKLGFKKAGYWHELNGKLCYKVECEESHRSKNGLYCIVVDREPKYFGVAKSTLQYRMKIYANGQYGRQIGVNYRNILKAANAEKEPQIYFMSNSDFLYKEEYPIDMAAGLISGLVDTFNPEWITN